MPQDQALLAIKTLAMANRRSALAACARAYAEAERRKSAGYRLVKPETGARPSWIAALLPAKIRPSASGAS